MYAANGAVIPFKLLEFSISFIFNPVIHNLCSGAGGPGVPAGQVRADHHQLQAQREEQEGKMVGD